MEYSKVIFLVGLGASAELYQPLILKLRAQLPQAEFTIQEWWKYPECGLQNLAAELQKSQAVLIGHSAGGILSLRALSQWPQQVQRIIMLDSHPVYDVKKLPSIEMMMNIMLTGGDPSIAKQVEMNYAPVKKDDTQFYQSFSETVSWVSANFDKTCMKIKSLPPHLALHIGLTDNNYQMYKSDAMQIEQSLWGKYGIDIKCMPMRHFDLIDAQRASEVANVVHDWLRLYF